MTSALFTRDRVRKAAHSENMSSVFDYTPLSNNKDLEKRFDTGTKEAVLFVYPPLSTKRTLITTSERTNQASLLRSAPLWITGWTIFQIDSCAKGCYLPIWVPRARTPTGTPAYTRTRARSIPHTRAVYRACARAVYTVQWEGEWVDMGSVVSPHIPQ